MNRLQVLICTFGSNGLERVASLNHPRVEGVEYLVCVQAPDGDPVIPDSLKRDDMRILTHPTVGVARNRNFALDHADAQVAMMTDDDVAYTADELLSLIDTYEKNPNAELITTRYRSADDRKVYPDHAFNLGNPPKGYYVSCIEISFRPDAIRRKVRFNENFGINTLFDGGEEDVFIFDAVKSGINAIFVPITVGTHNHPSTGTRMANHPTFIQTKGAVFLHMFPLSWPLRMIVHARRCSRAGGMKCGAYIRNWIRGVRKATRLRVFG